MDDLTRLQKMVENAIVHHDENDGDMGPLALSIAITEGLVNDWGFEVPGLIHSVREDRAYADGYKYGQRYPKEDTPQ